MAFDELFKDAGYVVLGLMVFFLSKLILGLFLPFDVDEELTEKDNPAIGVAVAGYLAGVVIVFLGGAMGSESAAISEVESAGVVLGTMGIVFGYALTGVVLLNVGRMILDKAVLPKFCMIKEITEDRNVGAGAVECGSYISTGLVVGGSLYGEGGGFLTMLVFFVVGQVTLILFAKCYQWTTKYDFHKEIEGNNVAAGMAFCFNLIAMGVILLKAVGGDYLGIEDSFERYYGAVLPGFVMLFLAHKASDFFLLSKSSLTHEIVNDRNVNGAWLEGVCVVGVSCLIYFLL